MIKYALNQSYVSMTVLIFMLLLVITGYIHPSNHEKVPVSVFTSNENDKSFMEMRVKESTLFIMHHAEIDLLSVDGKNLRIAILMPGLIMFLPLKIFHL